MSIYNWLEAEHHRKRSVCVWQSFLTPKSKQWLETHYPRILTYQYSGAYSKYAIRRWIRLQIENYGA